MTRVSPCPPGDASDRLREGRDAFYTVEVPSLQGRTRTLVTTYDYRGWGERSS